MKKTGRGRGYDAALIHNLVRSLTLHKRITTTASKGKRVKTAVLKRKGGVVRIIPLQQRRGDGAMMVAVEWHEHKNTSNKTKPDTENVASD
jgi:ribosomal protein L17